jgi:GTP-binding protein HflX
MDKVEDQFLGKLAAKQYPNSFQISSHNPDDIEKLRSHIIQYFLDQQAHYDLFVPYALGDVHSKIKANTNIIKMKTHENGIFYRIRVPDFIFGPLDLNEFILGPQDPRISELES